MKLLISAIGKSKASSLEQQLFNDYAKRLPWKLECKEFDVRPANKEKEGEKLLEASKSYNRLICLDESGKSLSSHEFSAQLQQWQQQGHSSFAFVIGGADGLDAKLLKKSNLIWSFGRVTWPHMLVRGLLAEQLYRAYTLQTGHPYHRA
jgi:23S rRNA (pseudouridine1915-N3)-methyltransferase